MYNFSQLIRKCLDVRCSNKAMRAFVLANISTGFTLLIIPAGEVQAKITLKGCIKWWHPGVAAMDQRKAWWPLKRTEVEVEWDGAGRDKTQLTNSSGCYSKSVRNAIWPYDSHNMNVQPYAKRAFNGKSGTLYVRAFETNLDIYPTYVESSKVKVKDNKTGKKDLWIGNNREFGGIKPNFKKGNLVEASRKYYWWNLASVDIVGRFYDWAHAKGFRQRRSIDIIAPALGESAYVNILTNNINMTYSTNPGSTSTGFSRWAFTLLHEGTHALHAHVSPSLSEWAPGIIRPARHNLYTITSPKIAWTEGFAAFLPVAYLADRGVLGAYANAHYTGADWKKFSRRVKSSSFIENHMNSQGQLQRNMRGTLWGDTSWFNDPNSAQRGGAEGFVAGFLWDLIDSDKNTDNHRSHRNLINRLAKNSGLPRSKCQVENTLKRTYRNLPKNNSLNTDSLLAYNTDCLSMSLREIAAVLEDRMRNNVTQFGNALVNGKNQAVRYEILKSYIRNGMPGAVPDELKAMQNWRISYAPGRRITATPVYKTVGGISANQTSRNPRRNQLVKIEIPVQTQNASEVQFKSSRCTLGNLARQTTCITKINSRGEKSIISTVRRSDFCTGTFGSKVGQSMKSPTFVGLDDGVNPVAIPALVCLPNIQGA